MRVLVFHGYLLRGTGSNVYNASLAQALARLGHEVHLLCQDRSAGELDWVASVGGDGEPGTVTVHLPEIGGLLPVYVADSYAGFEVRTFAELGDGELDRYLEANVVAVRGLIEAAGPPDAALANHLVMGPAILARAGLGAGDGGPGFAAKVHGSALEYTVKPDPDRFLPFAREGLESASAVLCGSRHTAESLWAALDLPGLEQKTRLGPPGVDIDLFTPTATREEASERARTLALDLRREANEPTSRAAASRPEISEDERAAGQREATTTLDERVAGHGGPPPDARSAKREDAGGGDGPTGPASRDAGPASDPVGPSSHAANVWGRSPREAADALEWFAAGTGPRAIFVGKLIVSKGVDLLLAAWPLVAARHPDARLLVVGFGEYREALQRLWMGFAVGNPATGAEIVARGRGLEGGAEGRLQMLGSFLEDPGRASRDYYRAAVAAQASVRFCGRLEHGEVARVVPAADALVFPSTFPEAFGMVAAEAAAAGVLPVGAAHSGIAEVSRELAVGLPQSVAPLVSFPLGERAVEEIAERLNAWFALPAAEREPARATLRETVRRRWSWEGVARGLIAGSQGRLDGLPGVPADG